MKWIGIGVILAALAAGETVKDDQTTLRDGCSQYDHSVAKLPKGTSVSIRYAVSGESVACYKVSAEVDGKPVEGFLPGSAIESLESFDKTRREVSWMASGPGSTWLETVHAETAQIAQSVRAGGSNSDLARQAVDLLDANRPLKALAILQPALKGPKDAMLLALAGAAARQSDDPKQALEYWKESLEMGPNPQLEELYRNLQRESQGDQSNQRLYGLRVVLRYESPAVSTETARKMTAVLDEEFERISNELGCSSDEKIIAIAQSRDAYMKTTQAMEWSGGQFDGRIRVPVIDGNTMDPELRRTLAHETVHACLTMLGKWPAWLHEGLAQKLSGDTLSASAQAKLAEKAAKGELAPLNKLTEGWSRMDAEHAASAYNEALAAVNLFYRDYAAYGVRNLLKNPDKLNQIATELDQKLGVP